MEAFSLLKYWRNSGGGPDPTPLRSSSNSTTTIRTAVSSLASETDDDDDDGPFFDLEFSLPDEEDDVTLQQPHSKPEQTDVDNEDADSDDSEAEDDNELKFTLSSRSSADCTDPNVSVSPSDDLFFKGQLVPVDHSATDLNGLENNTSKLNFPVSLVKSARVMMLKLKKSKSLSNTENVESKTLKKDKQEKVEAAEEEGKEQNKLFTVKFKASEVPIVSSLFVRDNSSKKLTSSKVMQKENTIDEDDKKFSKETVQRYLKKVKPLYIRVSKRYGEKFRFSGQLDMPGAAKEGITATPCTAEIKADGEIESTAEGKDGTVGSILKNAQKQQGSFPAGLRVVYKHLGKSRSASSATVAAAPQRVLSSKRRDDSLLQQQDGIQGAILHCKRSFKSSRDMDCSILERSVSAGSSSGDKERSR